MNCRECRMVIHEQMDKRLCLSKPSAVDEHLANCQPCRDFAAAAQVCLNLLANANQTPIQVPAGFSDRVFNRMLNTKVERVSATYFNTGKPWFALAASFALCCLLVLLWTLFIDRYRHDHMRQARLKPGINSTDAINSQWAQWLLEGRSFNVINTESVKATMSLAGQYSSKATRILPDLDSTLHIEAPALEETFEPVKKVGVCLASTLDPLASSAERAYQSFKSRLPLIPLSRTSNQQ